MIVRSILVVCIGNICRSPVGGRFLESLVPSVNITSAGLYALVGFPADSQTSVAASRRGISLAGHVARQFTSKMGASCDLILVMEASHRRIIDDLAPSLTGRTMLFDNWTGGKGIADPYNQPDIQHLTAVDQISKAALAWSERLT